jgi:hypothetical protein
VTVGTVDDHLRPLVGQHGRCQFVHPLVRDVDRSRHVRLLEARLNQIHLLYPRSNEEVEILDRVFWPLHKNASAACVCDSCKMCGPHYQDRRLRGSALLMSSERKQIDSEVCRLVGRGGAHERESLAPTSAAFYGYDKGTKRSRQVTEDLPRRENR